MGEKFNSRRDFIKTVALATAGVLIGASPEAKGETSSENKEKDEKLIHELFLERKILPNEGKDLSEKIDLWEKRYSGNDEGYDKLELLYRKRHNLPLKTINQELKEGWGRLLECDLETVYQITEAQGVPFDLIFVALAESHWKNEARS